MPAPTPPAVPARTPAWLLVAVGLLFVGGAAWLARWYFNEPKLATDLTQYQSNVGPDARADRPPEEIVLRPDGTGVARVPGLSVRFADLRGKPSVTAAGRVGREETGVADLRASNALAEARKPRRREAAGVTAAQWQELAAVRYDNPDVLPPDTRTKLLALWSQARTASAASRPVAEAEILDLLRTTAAANAARKNAFHAAAETVRRVMSEEQIAKLQPGAATRPATRPTTRPRRAV